MTFVSCYYSVLFWFIYEALMINLNIIFPFQELKPEEKRAKDRKMWQDWIEQYRWNTYFTNFRKYYRGAFIKQPCKICGIHCDNWALQFIAFSFILLLFYSF